MNKTHIKLTDENNNIVLFPVQGSVFREMPHGTIQCMASMYSINPQESFNEVMAMLEINLTTGDMVDSGLPASVKKHQPRNSKV
jgi:hypothetical protein